MSAASFPGHHTREQHFSNAFKGDKHPHCYKSGRKPVFQGDNQQDRTVYKGDRVERSNQLAIERGLAKSRLSDIFVGVVVLRKDRRDFFTYQGKGEARDLPRILLKVVGTVARTLNVELKNSRRKLQ